MKIRFAAAKRLCGLAEDFEINSKETLDYALRFWRERTVAARRKNDDHTAAVLSECKEVFKKRYNRIVSRHCPTCGEAKSAHSMQCRMCSYADRYLRHNLPSHSAIMKTHEIEEGLVVVPAITHRTGELSSICRKIATTGQIGDSFVTPKSSTSVNGVARTLGMKVLIRCANPEEKDKKKRLYRVWRSDGFDMDQVNEIIRKRLAKEPVEPAKPCVPPPPGTLPPKHPKAKKEKTYRYTMSEQQVNTQLAAGLSRKT
jgi:predicted RNA-binding Zn-ribbon protein involved in translation (DUF1610 family)